MSKKNAFFIIASFICILILAACSSETSNSDTDDEKVYCEISDLQLVLLNSILYKDSLIQLEGKSIEGHDELIDDKYKNNISGGDTLVDNLKGFTLVDIDYGDVTGFKAAAFIKENNLVIVYCGTDHPTDFVDDAFAGVFDFSAQDGQAKAFAKDNVKKYEHHDLYITGYSMGARLSYLGTEDVIDNNLGDNLKKVRTFNGLGVKEALDFTDGNLSNIHNLEMKFADKTYNYIVKGDSISDRDTGSFFVNMGNYTHVGTDLKVPCTNEIDNGIFQQHDLYSIIDYLLNNPEPGTLTDNRTEESTNGPTQKPALDTNDTPTDSQIVDDQINPGDHITFETNEQDITENIQLISLNANINNRISVDGVNTDTITIRTDSGNNWATTADLNVNGIIMNYALPFVPAHFDEMSVTDLNANDDYRNLIIELSSEYDTSRTYVFCYNADSVQVAMEVSGNYDVSSNPGNGTFYTWCSAGYGTKEIGPASYRREYSIDGLTLTEVGSSVGYFTDEGFKNNYVDGYPVMLSAPLSVYSDADCTQLLGSIPTGTSATITDGREKLDAYGYSQGFDFYIESSAGSGWTSFAGLDSVTKSDYHLA